MPKRIAMNVLNGKTIDIINVIRQNASMAYQQSVPSVTTEQDIPVVGEHICGTPANANEFVNALLNRIALVQIKSSLFNNPYKELKKGYLEYGETVEEVFVEMAKAREFSVEKAESREFKRTLPDVRSAFHLINWRVQYPISVEMEELRQAFLSADGVTNLITNIINSTYRGAEYDEYLLFKYLIIKAVSHGKMYPVSYDASDIHNAAEAFRGYSNELEFVKTQYNVAGVHTETPKSDQYIFMDSHYNAKFDVGVLASAFNMEKADFMGRLKLIDSFTTFDNERFDIIRQNSTQIEEVTSAELALMANVKAVVVDKEWFQVYDNLMLMSDTRVSSGLYWNYNLNVWKTISSSPFSNAIVYVSDSTAIDTVDSVTLKVTSVIKSVGSTIITLEPQFTGASLAKQDCEFIQTQASTTAGVAIHKYGAVIIPDGADAQTVVFKIGDMMYSTTSTLANTADVGDTLTANYIGAITAVTVKTNASADIVLSPTFDSETTAYTASVASTVTSAVFTVSCTGDVEVYNGTTKVTISDGKYTCTLSTGANTIKIVTEGRVYTFTITKAS